MDRKLNKNFTVINLAVFFYVKIKKMRKFYNN